MIKRELASKISKQELDIEITKLTEVKIVPLEKSIRDINEELRRVQDFLKNIAFSISNLENKKCSSF